MLFSHAEGIQKRCIPIFLSLNVNYYNNIVVFLKKIW